MVKNKDHPDWYHANHLGEMFEIYFETLLEYRDEEGEPLVVEADRDGLFEKYERNVAKYKKRAEESLGERQPWVGQYCMERWLWCELLGTLKPFHLLTYINIKQLQGDHPSHLNLRPVL